MSLFQERVNLKPYEYPELLDYKDAIRQSYWVHDEFSFDSDVQDFRVNCTPAERSVIMKTMLAISQVEVSVKTFWADIYKKMPLPEISSVGMTFSESEVRHLDAYSHLLGLLGLEEEFERIEEIPALTDRIEYLGDYQQGGEDLETNRDFALSILLFSLFIEHVSLFGQFLIMLSFDKYRKQLTGIANAVEATSKEEQVHGLFGMELIHKMQDEKPEWFDEEFNQRIQEFCRKAEAAEMKVLDWIFSEGELEFLPKVVVKEFVRDKFNRSMKQIGFEPLFDPNELALDETKWFYEEILLTKGNDFFAKRGTTYSKMTQSVGADDIF